MNRPLKDVVQESALIVRGRTGESYSDWGKSESRTIYTYTHFAVTEVFKGKLGETNIVLRQPGGSKDGIELHVPGAATFTPGEDIVVLLGPRFAEDGSYDVPGFTTGKYNVIEKDGRVFLESSLGGGEVYHPGKDSHSDSYDSRVPIEVFRELARGGNPPQADRKQFSSAAPSTGPKGVTAPQAPTAGAGTSVPQKTSPSQGVNAAFDTASSEEKRPLWIPLSFLALIAAGGFLIWRLLKKGGGT
ncbi:MAG: hypothetical protein HYW49_12800 [Deltaproteobacteria bacterium]|nr:hypothetical protein [Deltaproteobacteria bacterium]